MDSQTFNTLLHKIFAQDPELNNLSLEEILNTIPTINELSALPSGTPVLVRTDIDVPIKEGQVIDKTRLIDCSETIKFCRSKGWKTIIMGHVGRDKTNSAMPLCQTLNELLQENIVFIENWLDETANKLTDECVQQISQASASSIFLLDNTRKYDIERALWKADDSNFSNISQHMYTISKDIRERLTAIEINEAFAASNMDFSSVAIPLLMERTAMGFYIAEQMQTHIRAVRTANCIVFSGLKMDKLDDLEGIVERDKLIMIVAAGAVGMVLQKARADLKGQPFSAGIAETDPTSKAFIEPKRVEQAKRIIQTCEKKNIALILPIDFLLDNGEVNKEIPEGHLQLDIGPESRKLFAQKIREYIHLSKTTNEPFAMFYSGVFGKFEDPQFAEGTKTFIPLLKEMTQAGIKTYVGGGEGRLALIKYGSEDDVTYAFTAGGTVLTSLTNNHIPYLKAMYLQNTFKK